MAHKNLRDKLTLFAAATADDLGYVALHDLSQILAGIGSDKDLVIGGHMVTLHTLRWGPRGLRSPPGS
jgi:hypothetical protein